MSVIKKSGPGIYCRIAGGRYLVLKIRLMRNDFSEVVQLNPNDPVATAIVGRIDELFAIEAEARQQALRLEALDALRQQKSRPLLDDLRKQIEAARSTALPGGALAKACNYTLSRWDKLTRFLEYPELELSNNLAENSMRPVALGRKNGCTSEVRRQDRRSPLSFPSWKAVVD